MMRLWHHVVKGAELVAALMFAIMFGVMILQVVFRYFLGMPLKWTLEFNLIVYTWILFWGATFLVRERENVAFNLIYDHVPQQVRRVLAASSTLIILVVYAVSLPGNYDFVSFMKILDTPILHWRYDYVFLIFIIYMISVIIGSVVRLVFLFRQGWREQL